MSSPLDLPAGPTPAPAMQTMDSPVGTLRLAADARGLTAVVFAGRNDAWLADADPAVAMTDTGAQAHIDDASAQLAGYFAGKRTAFDLPLAARGTPFQRAVWELLAAIPRGETTSYGELARRLSHQLGRTTSPRAVGAAVGRNPLSIVVPCHRVVGADGRLTGYAGGLAAKRWLLRHEGVAVTSANRAARVATAR